MRKLFLKLSALLFVLTMGVSATCGQEDVKVYFASLKAQSSPESTGSGLVKLTWVDITGAPLTVELAKKLNYAAFQDPSRMTRESAYDGFGETAHVVGATMSALDGMETMIAMMPQIFMTSSVYYYAQSQPANGSYFADWTFTEPAITRMPEPMGGSGTYVAMYNNNKVVQYDNPLISPCFKVLPDTVNNAMYSSEEALGTMAYMVANTEGKYNNLYAVFNKYLLSNPQAENGHMNANESSATFKVSVDVEGDASQLKANYADFDFPVSNFVDNAEGTWSWAHASENPIENISSTKKRYNFTITFAPKTQDLGRKNATLTIRMAHADPSKASTLNIPLSVDVRPAATADATLYDGKTPTEISGTLTDMIEEANGTDKIVVLNRQYNAALNVNADVTIDLNGYDLGALTINGGNVTLAYSAFGGSATSLTVNGGKAILNGGTFGSLTIGASGKVEQNGATVTGAASNSGSLTVTQGTINGGLTSSKTLVLNGGTFKGTTAATVSGGTAAINRGTIEGTTCGLKVTGGAATTKKLAAIKGATYSAQQTGGTLNVECGKFDGQLNGTINFTSGYFKTNSYGISTTGLTEMNVSAGLEYSEGYRYFLGTSESALANGAGVCRIGTTSYTKLEDAIAYANNNPLEENIVIFMTNDYTLPAGYYTLPANATIVVPMSDTQAKEVNKTAPRVIFNDANRSTPYVEPTEYRRLTIASGVNMDVFGNIEMTCSQFASNEAYTGQPCGPYGHIVMEEGSHMTLQSGSEVRAWGFMTGKGEIDARRGSIVREMFQLGDWKGALTSVKIVGMAPQVGDDSEKKIFPVTQYFIQNIESPVKYHPGSLLSTSAAVSEGLAILSVSMTAADIGLIGVSRANSGGTDDPAIFLMDVAADAENTWVRKWYDVENDIQVYEINSGAHIGSMVLDMGDLFVPIANLGTVPIKLNSAKFDLPLTCNFKIHLLSGSMDFKQNTSLLPGAEVEVDKGSTVSVAMSSAEKTALKAWKDAGSNPEDKPMFYTGALYVYDADEWGQYAYCNAYNGESMETGTAYTKVVRYSPSWNGRPTVHDEQVCPGDATINVRGTFQTASGFVYTSEHGANIFSSNEDAGTFIFNDDAVNAGTRDVWNVIGASTYEDHTFYPARLKHGNGTYENTDEAVKDLAYCYQNDKWSTMIQDGCFMKENRGGQDVYYAKPQEYVALSATKLDDVIIGNDDETFSDADGAGRLFILVTGDDENECQWWEVEKKDNLYHCIHPENDTYYYWDGVWKEKTFTVTWLNWDGDTIQTANKDGVLQKKYKVTYGTQAEFLGTNPIREENIDYTYDFTGWTPALGPVTQNVTYTATFEQKDRMYTITFLNEGGTLIETQFLKHNDVPVCSNPPTKVGYHLIWSPAIGEVIGDQTYTATWEEELPEEWDVTFVNNAGGVLQATATVGVNEHPEYEGATPAKENADHTAYSSNEYTYTFWGWSAVIDGEKQQFAANAELPCPTAPTTYTAVYTEAAKEYTITFKNEDNSVIGTPQKYQYGETPVCSNLPTKAADAQYTYKLRWNPQIQTVMADATYKAVFDATTNKYTVSVKSNPSGACSISGAGIYDYNTSATAVTITITPNAGYTFTGWSDNQGGKNTTRQMAITGDINLVANFTVAEPDYTITWKNEDGSANLVDPVGQKAGTATTYTGPTPTKAATSANTFEFDGWATKANGPKVYKNGMTPKATANATYYAHFAATPIPSLEVNGAPVVLTEAVTYQDLIITSNGTNSSSQLVGSNNLTLTGNAYFDLAINAKNHTWYAISVPWQVNPETGISVKGRTLKFGREFDILYYDGAKRGEVGKTGEAWKYLELKEGDKTMQPGHLYMIGLTNDAPVIRFAKKEGAPLLTNTTSVSLFEASDVKHANWNGIANPALFHAYVNAGVTKGQMYDVDSKEFTNIINLDSKKLVLGQAVFVQVPAAKQTITVTYGGSYAAAPRRAKATTTEPAEYEVRITPYGAEQYADRLFVQVDEDKENGKYVIGKDLVKFGVSSKVAQMWINRYDAKLCMNTMALVDETAEFPLGIYVPAEGKYTIGVDWSSLTNQQHALYLTYDGEAIWNLSKGAITLNLPQGTETHYGLRLGEKKAPQTATAIDEAIVDAQEAVAAKVLIGNQVFIIRGEKVYSIDGQLLK